MIVRAVGLFTCTGRGSALYRLVVQIMVFLLFPSMTVATPVLKAASIHVSARLLFIAPDSTLVFWIVINVNLASEILPVMGIHTDVTRMVLVLFVAKRTPNCLEMKQVEVHITLHPMKVIDWQLVFVMGKGTHLSELARVNVIWIGLAEFRFVFFWMVEVFYGVVCAWAAVA